MSSILGLITARGGSKGISGKNIKELAGKPLIAWTIEAAQSAGVFDRIILSSDDVSIQNVARTYGCEVPFLRPAELASDTAGHVEVVVHALEWLREQEGYTPEYVMLLQPTSPTRQDFHIREAVEQVREHPDADSVLSVAYVPNSYNSKKTMALVDGYLRLVHTGEPIYKRVARRQNLQNEYYSTGLIYLCKTSLLLGDNPNLYGDKTVPYVIDQRYVLDIDEPSDWDTAEQAMKVLMQ